MLTENLLIRKCTLILQLFHWSVWVPWPTLPGLATTTRNDQTPLWGLALNSVIVSLTKPCSVAEGHKATTSSTGFYPWHPGLSLSWLLVRCAKSFLAFKVFFHFFCAWVYLNTTFWPLPLFTTHDLAIAVTLFGPRPILKLHHICVMWQMKTILLVSRADFSIIF